MFSSAHVLRLKEFQSTLRIQSFKIPAINGQEALNEVWTHIWVNSGIKIRNHVHMSTLLTPKVDTSVILEVITN